MVLIPLSNVPQMFAVSSSQRPGYISVQTGVGEKIETLPSLGRAGPRKRLETSAAPWLLPEEARCAAVKFIKDAQASCVPSCEQRQLGDL